MEKGGEGLYRSFISSKVSEDVHILPPRKVNTKLPLKPSALFPLFLLFLFFFVSNLISYRCLIVLSFSVSFSCSLLRCV